MSGTKGSVEEAHKRNLEIVRLRSTGLTWPKVAEQVGVTERTCRRAFGDYCATVAEDHDHGSHLHVIAIDSLNALDLVAEQAQEMLVALPAADINGRVGLLKVKAGVNRTKLALVTSAGYMRHSAGTVEAERLRLREQMEEVLRLVDDVLSAAPDSEARERLAAEYREGGLGLPEPYRPPRPRSATAAPAPAPGPPAQHLSDRPPREQHPEFYGDPPPEP